MATTSFAAGAYAATQSLGVGALGAAKPAGAAAAAGGLNFGSLLQGALEGVAQSGHKAEAQALSAATGKADIVDVVTAVAESEAALETLVAVRDRVIAAYEEIMRMPIRG
jgi:flagellar hook-basal body complex protein FliE